MESGEGRREILHPQLSEIVEGLRAAEARVDRIASNLTEAQWAHAPAPGRWSVGECVSHLNLTSRAFLPLLDAALAEARSKGDAAPARYRLDFIGWLLERALTESARFRSRTSDPFVPAAGEPPARLLTAFRELQAELIARVQAANGLPITRVRIPSPFNPRVRYSVYSSFRIIVRHQHRHLWQAEQIPKS